MHLVPTTPTDSCSVSWCVAHGDHIGHTGKAVGPVERDPDTGEVTDAAQARILQMTDESVPLVELLIWQADDTEAGEGMHHLLTSAEARQLARALDKAAARADRVALRTPVC